MRLLVFQQLTHLFLISLSGPTSVHGLPVDQTLQSKTGRSRPKIKYSPKPDPARSPLNPRRQPQSTVNVTVRACETPFEVNVTEM
jgi:hypothetical protein